MRKMIRLTVIVLVISLIATTCSNNNAIGPDEKGDSNGNDCKLFHFEQFQDENQDLF